MSRSPKEKLEQSEPREETETATSDQRELYLRDGRKIVVDESGSDQLVEIRSDSGMLELRIKLTAEGPVLQMESVRMQLKASESLELQSKKVEIKGEDVKVKAEQDLELDANKDVRVRCVVDEDAEPGTHGNIYLN
jgi:hypothetical protein